MRLLLAATLIALALPSTAAAAGPNEGVRVHVKAAAKIIISPAAIEIDEAVMAPDAYEELVRRLARTKGVDLITTPSVTFRQGETAKVEIIRCRNAAAQDADPIGQFVGWMLHLEAKPAGEQIELLANVRHGFSPGGHFLPLVDEPVPIDWDSVVIKSAGAGEKLAAKQTCAVSLGELEPGVHAICFVTVTPIDAAGQATESFADRIPGAEPEGVVGVPFRVRARRIDVPRKAELFQLQNLDTISPTLFRLYETRDL